MTLIDDKKYQFDDAVQHLKGELNSIRTGRATPSLVESLTVDYYGAKTPLQQLAAIAAPDPRSLLIQPWDKNSTKDIEKAIQASPLGLNPVNEGNAIRLPIPSLTEERRKELVKIVHQKVEGTKVSIRNIREEMWRTIKEQKKQGRFSEDEMFLHQKELQKMIDQYNGNIRELGEAKEKEIMTI